MPTVNFQNLRASHELPWFIVDVVMMALLFINLTWLLLDWFYAIGFIRDALGSVAPGFTAAYDPIHRNIFYYDLVFVAIFLTEFMVRWVRAVVHRDHARWYFFPFVHWYDLAGCIPLTGWRFLRILRILSILNRLHRYGVINVKELKTWQFFSFYYEAFLEELSDRIVLKVLSGAQEEIKDGSPVIHRLQHDVLVPRKPLINEWVSTKVADAARRGYLPNEPHLRLYMERIVDDAMQKSSDLERIRQIPMVGSTVSETLERSVGNITTEIIHQIMQDLASRDNHAFIEELTDVFLDQDKRTDPATDLELKLIAHQVIDIVKDHVSVKRWRKEL
ncbi:hypothetical protein [Hydrocarboniclastica marina]|uniref:Ion transporter n=1 Tax=Hydrocarboniclastica marina TaxID=2259620 RepID=A0A4P7XHB3_9ALTE|nr:hypothetical protein [Hydrocarboniclastica marina]MAM00539.1 hypothetical protein [Alteromonadaceae bacterium]QCF26406.1 hypothetical protein soil367_10905 [Hydrocarboniclastica marina]